MGSFDVAYTDKIDRAIGTKSFRFECPAGLEYLPGQFFNLTIPKDDQQWLRHHFSFSSSPTEPFIEVTTRMTGSEFKDALDGLLPGTIVEVSGPEGDFIAREEMGKIAFVVGGIGVTPARSTVRWAADTHSALDIVVVYANRDSASTAFKEELDSLTSERIRVVHILDQPEEGWAGLKGRIDAGVIRAQVADWRERCFFVCGPPGMVDAIAAMLAGEVGVAEDRLMIEHFTGY